MTYVYAPDGTNVERIFASLPARLRRRLTDGATSTPTAATAAEFGLYPVTEVTSPGDGYVRTIVSDGQGGFTEQWAFDQALLDTINKQAARDLKLRRVGAQVATLREWADDAQRVTVTNGNNTVVTQRLVDRLAVFFDRFADLIEGQRLDD